MRGRHDLTDAEWAIVSPLPPDKPRGVPRVDDRRAISGIFHILRTGTPWAGKRGSGSRHRTLARRAEHLYRQRNHVGRFFNKLKHFRGIATRHHKLARNFLAAIAIASIRLWIKINESTT